MSLYVEQFLESHDFPRFDGVPKILVLASTPRCGSHMLGHSLYQTGAFGFPLEYLNESNLKEWKRRLGRQMLADVVRELQRRRTSPNGVFGIKLHYSHLNQFKTFERVTELLPNACYVLIRRRDVVRQAVSYAIAAQTNVWIAGQESENPSPEYDFDLIDGYLREIIRDTCSWRYLLAVNACNFIEVDYESMLSDMAAVINRLAGWMGVAVEPSRLVREPATIRQGGWLNEEWRRRFLEEHNPSSVMFEKDTETESRALHPLRMLIDRLSGRRPLLGHSRAD